MCPFVADQRLTIHFPQRLNRYACISSSSWVTFHSCIVEAPPSFGSRWRLANIGGFVVLLHCLHSGQMPMIDNRAKGPSKETQHLNSIASVLWAFECHPDKAALWLLAFNLCVFLSQVSHSHLAASATDCAHNEHRWGQIKRCYVQTWRACHFKAHINYDSFSPIKLLH